MSYRRMTSGTIALAFAAAWCVYLYVVPAVLLTFGRIKGWDVVPTWRPDTIVTAYVVTAFVCAFLAIWFGVRAVLLRDGPWQGVAAVALVAGPIVVGWLVGPYIDQFRGM